MTDEKRIWLFFLAMTMCLVGLLVLLAADGMDGRVVLAIAVIALAPEVLLFRGAWRMPVGSRLRNIYYRWTAFAFTGLIILHFIVDRRSVK